MKYSDGNNVKLGDRVFWIASNPIEKGTVVCLIDEGKFLDGYDFTLLKQKGGGIMVLFDDMGLVQIFRDDDTDLGIIKRKTGFLDS
ncbi:hypothetical protein [Neisseria zalophi]|uniref:Uncharacterized protein n=1 Tax=Neisseria zalophi TaxID=640030 RepID=A0A5J6PZA9_9NEIS|nr:hypothetical protein [Neisseria zalophi]QEY26192.1 hypothetical protein D0T92_06415 [Neisseria zalophi]